MESSIRLAEPSSHRHISNSLRATIKITACTPSKQCIHLRRSFLCPPTSKNWKILECPSPLPLPLPVPTDPPDWPDEADRSLIPRERFEVS